MAHEIVSAQKVIDRDGKQVLPRLGVTEYFAAKVALTGAGGASIGSEQAPIPVSSKILEQLLFDNNRMLARWLNANDLLDSEDLASYLV